MKQLFSQASQNLLPFDGEVYYFPDFFSNADSNDLYQKIKNETPWRHEPIKLFGKEIMQPRLTALYGNPEIKYGYSGILMTPEAWSPVFSMIKDKVEEVSEIGFTHVLVNYYRTGQDSMGWHRDNERVLGIDPIIASVSFGAARRFELRPYNGKKPKVSIVLEHGSLLLMKGSTQHFWEHQLPKIKKETSGRINLTFRKIIQ